MLYSTQARMKFHTLTTLTTLMPGERSRWEGAAALKLPIAFLCLRGKQIASLFLSSLCIYFLVIQKEKPSSCCEMETFGT